MALDILIPLGNGSAWGNNNELRYCLRSIERYAIGYDRIFVIGEDPGFLNGQVRFCPLPEIEANKEARIASKILRAFEQTDIADDAVMFNDDYVLTAPVDLSTLPFYHRGELSLGIPSQGSVLYRAALGDTVRALRQAGRPTLHYDVHMPMILNRQKFIGLRDWWTRSEKSWQGFVCKSIYANNQDDIDSQFTVDCKLQYGDFKAAVIDEIVRNRWVFSYADGALTDSLKLWLAKRFPQRCKAEADRVDLASHRMSVIAKQAIYKDAKGNIVERTNNPMQHCFLLVPKGAVIPPHVLEKLKKKEATESAAATKPLPPELDEDATKRFESRQKRIVRPSRKRSPMVEAIE